MKNRAPEFLTLSALLYVNELSGKSEDVEDSPNEYSVTESVTLRSLYILLIF